MNCETPIRTKANLARGIDKPPSAFIVVHNCAVTEAYFWGFSALPALPKTTILPMMIWSINPSLEFIFLSHASLDPTWPADGRVPAWWLSLSGCLIFSGLRAGCCHRCDVDALTGRRPLVGFDSSAVVWMLGSPWIRMDSGSWSLS